MKKFPNARPFAPTFSPEDFEKKILKRIHVQGERDFALSLYSEDPDVPGFLVFRAELDKKGLKRLKALAKAIRKNRGFVSWGKLAVVGVLVVGYLTFNLVFKNWIMTGFLENSLENVFSAKADVKGLDFDPLAGKVTLAGLSVADRDHPMRNLFELGKTGFSVDLWQAVNGRLLIQFLEFEDIRFGSDRKVSGALPGRAPTPAPAASSPPASTAPASGAASASGLVDLGKFDAAALVSSRLDQLESIRLAKALEQDIGGTADKAKAEAAGVQSQVKGLAAAAGTRILQNLSSVRTKDDLNAALAKSTDFKAEIAAAQKQTDAWGRKLQDESKAYEARLKDLEGAVQRDRTALAKTLSQPQEAGSKLVQEVFGQVLGPQSRDLMALAAKVPGVLASLKEGEEKPAKIRRQGRTVVFPTPAHPQLEIRKISGSLAFGGGTALAVRADEISSDQEITGPTSLALEFGDPRTDFRLKATADLRKASPAKLIFDAALNGASLNLGREVSPLGLKSLTAGLRLRGGYRLGADGNARATATIQLDRVKVEREKDSLVGRLSEAAVASLGQRLSAQGEWTLTASGDATFSLTSDLDRAFAEGLRSAAAAELKKQQDQIAAALDAQLNQVLGADRAGELKSYLAANAADLRTLADLQRKVDQQTADLERLGKLLGGAGGKPANPLGGLKLPGF